MPAHIPFEHLNHLVRIVFDANAAVFFDVADRHQIKLQLTEAFGKFDLLVIGEMLVREDEQRVLKPGVVQPAEGCLVNFGQLESGHGCPKARVERFHMKICHRSASSSVASA